MDASERIPLGAGLVQLSKKPHTNAAFFMKPSSWLMQTE